MPTVVFLLIFLVLQEVFCFRSPSYLKKISNVFIEKGNRRQFNLQHHSPFTTVMIVPTGVGASIGGYAGDSLPSARLLASASDILITHPNVMNGAMLYWLSDKIQYVDGAALDEFAENKIMLDIISKNAQRIGLLLDSGIEKDLRLRHIQVAESMKATLGIDVRQIAITSKPLNVITKVSSQSGASWGSIENIESLVEAGRKLKEMGCTAIAVVARFPEDSCVTDGNDLKSTAEYFDDYRKGQGVDAIAGVEAIISRILSQEIGLPCAHAPAFAPMEADEEVSPKAAAEEIGYTFLPCVLAYLHRAPNLIRSEQINYSTSSNCISAKDVDAVVVPYNALGGPAVLSFISQGKMILAVKENQTAMKVDKASLLNFLPKEQAERAKIIEVQSYAEAAGYLLAMKEGILFESLTSHVSRIPQLQL